MIQRLSKYEDPRRDEREVIDRMDLVRVIILGLPLIILGQLWGLNLDIELERVPSENDCHNGESDGCPCLGSLERVFVLVKGEV